MAYGIFFKNHGPNIDAKELDSYYYKVTHVRLDTIGRGTSVQVLTISWLAVEELERAKVPQHEEILHL